MQTLAAYTESFCIITPGGFLYRRVLYKYMLEGEAACFKNSKDGTVLASSRADR